MLVGVQGLVKVDGVGGVSSFILVIVRYDGYGAGSAHREVCVGRECSGAAEASVGLSCCLAVLLI